MNLEATSGAIPALVPAPVYKTVVEDGKTFQLIPRTVTNTVGHSYTSASYNWINSALQSGVDMRAAGGFSAVSGLLITPIKVIFVGAMDTISHAAKTAAKTLLLPVRSIHWVFAKNVPSPVKLVGDILAEAYRGVATAIATIPLAALSIASPSAALSLAKAINLTPAKREETTVVEDKVEFVETTIPQPVVVEAKVQGVWGKIRSSWVGQKVAAHPYIATVAGLAVTAGIVTLVVYGPTAYSASVKEAEIRKLQAQISADVLDDAAVREIDVKISALQEQLVAQNTLTDFDRETIGNEITGLREELAGNTLTDAECTKLRNEIETLNQQLSNNETASDESKLSEAHLNEINESLLAKQNLLNADKVSNERANEINQQISANEQKLDADLLTDADVLSLNNEIATFQTQLKNQNTLTDLEANTLKVKLNELKA